MTERTRDEIVELTAFVARCLRELNDYYHNDLALTRVHLARLHEVEAIIASAEGVAVLDNSYSIANKIATDDL